MIVDNCRESSCYNFIDPTGKNEFINVNGPFQVGGLISKNLPEMHRDYGWDYLPTKIGFSGCISNMTFNGDVCLLIR